MDIVHNGSLLHVKTTIKSNVGAATSTEVDCQTNGLETVNPKTGAHTTAKREGDTLTMVMQVKTGLVLRSRWTLPPDGNTLTVQGSTDTSVERLVFLKL
jgi:hypothetical protein